MFVHVVMYLGGYQSPAVFLNGEKGVVRGFVWAIVSSSAGQLQLPRCCHCLSVSAGSVVDWTSMSLPPQCTSGPRNVVWLDFDHVPGATWLASSEASPPGLAFPMPGLLHIHESSTFTSGAGLLPWAWRRPVGWHGLLS